MQYNRLNDPNALLKLIKALEQRVSSVETKGTGPIGFVGSDGVELHIGVQPDGQAAIIPFVGDVTPPPIATSPDASAGPGFITVTWDGLFVNGETMPLDFEHLNVVGNRIVNGVSDLTVEVGIIRNPMDSCLVGTEVAAVGETWEFVFVSEDYNGNLSSISAPSNQVVQKSFAADVLIDEALEGLQQDFIDAQNAAVSAQNAADAAQDAADEAALILTSKGAIYTQSETPDADPNGLWIDTGHSNVPRRYLGTGKALAVHVGGGASAGPRLTALGWTVTTITAIPTLEEASEYDLVAFDAGYAGLSSAYGTLASSLLDKGVSVFTSGNDTTNLSPLFTGGPSRGTPKNTIRPVGTHEAATGWAAYSDGDLNFYLTGVNPAATVTGVTLVTSLGTDQPLNIVMEHATTFARWAHVQTYNSPASVLDAHMNWIADNWIAIQDQSVVAAIAAAQLKADQAFNNAETAAEAAGNAQETADGKNTSWYQDDQPAGTSHKKGDTWYDTNDGYKLRTWTGSIWQTTQDSALAQQIAESKGRTYTQDVAPPVEARNDKNLWIDTSAGAGLYVTKYWNGSIWTALTNKDAADAQDLAESKGETIYSPSEPAAEKRLPQNTWIDTSGGLNIQKRWDGNAWIVVVDSRIPSTAAAVTAVDSRVTGVSAAASAEATAKSDAAAAAAINAQAYSKNASFDDWTSTYPVGYANWTGTPIKETSIVKRAPFAMRFNVPDATAQHGVSWSSIMAHAPNLEFFTVEVDLYLVSGTLDGSGMILDWTGMSNNRAQIQFATELPGAVTGKWYTVSKVLRRPTNATGTWTAMTGYLMGQWSGHGTGAAKNIIFDWFNVRPSTTEEILSYKAPTVTYVDQAEADAITAAGNAAALMDAKVNSSRTYINRGVSTAGITNVNGPAPVVVDSATAMGGKALQKTGTGNGWWADTNGKQAFDPTALYRMQARIKVNTPPTAGGGTFYMGVQGYLADGVTLCNATGSATTSSQHYLKVQSHPASGQWVDYVGYFKGNSTGNAGGSATVFDPYKLHANVRHFEPIVIMDYSNGNGVVELSQLSIEVVDTQAALDLAVADTNNKLLTKTRNYFQTNKPTGGTYLHGDVWIDTDDGNKVYVYDTTGGFNDFRVAQDTSIDKALYSTFPTDIDTSATNKWLFTKYIKGTSANHTPQYSDIVGFAGTSSLVSDASSMATAQGDQYIGQLRTIVNVVSTKTVALTATHDDGARIYVDGVSVYSSPVYTSNAAISFQLTAGWHVIDFMWAEQAGGDGWTAVSPLLSTQVTSMFAPVSLSSVAATANTAVTSANGKNKVIYSSDNASGTTGYSAGDTWFKRDPGTGVVSAQWEFTTSWQPRTLSENVIGNISAGKIVAEWLEAGVIKAGAIDATKLNVSMGGNNLVPNSSFEVDSDSNGLADSWSVWTRGSGDAGRVFTTTRVAGLFPGSTWAQRVESTTVTNTNQSSIQSTLVFAIGASAKAVLSVYGRASVAGSYQISLRCEDDAGVYKGDAQFLADFTTTAQRFSGLIVTPVGTTKAKVTISTPGSLSNGHWFEVDGVKAELGDMLSAWSPLTSELLPGTINATMLTADAINGKIITGPTIQTEVTASRGIKLTPTEFAGYDGAGVKNFSLTSAGSLTLKGAIQTGGSITGSTIQTETTADRGIKLTSTELAGFDAAGIKNFSLTSGGSLALKGAITSGSTITGATVTGSTIQTEATVDRGIKLTTTELAGYNASGVKNFSLLTDGTLSLKGSITSGSTITGTDISGGTVTGTTVQTETTPARGIKMTSTELAGYDASGVKNLSLTSAGALYLRGEIKSGSTIEGARLTGTQGIETSTVANTGVKINNLGIKAYDAGNNLTFHLDATTGMLEVPGLKANSITGDKLAADTVTAKHLAIGDFTNVAYGGEFNSPEEFANWSTNNATITYTTSAPQAGAGCMSVTAHASQRSATLGTTIAVQPGDKFNIEFYYKTSADYNGTSANAKFRVGDQANAHLQSTTYNTVQTSWTKVTNVYEVPASGVSALTLSLNFDHTVGTVWIDSLTMRKQVGSTLIQDGAITTDKITVTGLDGGRITAGTLTSTQIKAKSILADDLVISSTDNLVVEADFGNNGTSWDLGAAYKYIMPTRGRGGLPALRIVGSTGEVKARNLANKISVDPDNRYRATIWVRSTEALPIGKVKMYLRCYASATPIDPDFLVLSNDEPLVADTWTPITGIIPALPAGTLAVEVIIAAHNQTDTTWTEIDYVSLTRAMDASLVVDGSITAAKIDSEAVNATHIAAGSITASALDVEELWTDASWLGEAGASELKLVSSSSPTTALDPETGYLLENQTYSEVNSQGLRVYNLSTLNNPVSGDITDIQEIIKLGTFDQDFFSINKAGVPQITMNAEGNIAAQTIEVGTSANDGTLKLNGVDLGPEIFRRPRGMMAWGQVPVNSNMSVGAGSEIGLFEIAFDGMTEPARMYEFQLNNFLIETGGAGIYGLRLRYTTNGAQPTISSALLGFNYHRTDQAGLTTSAQFTRLIGSNNGEYIRVLVSLYASGSWAKVYSGTGQSHLYSRVLDLGETMDHTAIANTAGGTPYTGSPSVPPAPAKVTKTVEWGYTGVRSYTGTNAHYNYNTSKGYQGLSPAGYGNLKSIYIFPNTITSTLSGATINGIWLYAYFEHWYNGSGGTARFRLHTNTSLPSTYNGSGNGMNSGSWPRAAGRWVAVPSSLWGGFLGGATPWKGFGFEGDGGYGTYGICNNARIRITYTK